MFSAMPLCECAGDFCEQNPRRDQVDLSSGIGGQQRQRRLIARFGQDPFDCNTGVNNNRRRLNHRVRRSSRMSGTLLESLGSVLRNRIRSSNDEAMKSRFRSSSTAAARTRIASAFRLRPLLAAERFSPLHTSSGIFFSVKFMVPLWNHLALECNVCGASKTISQPPQLDQQLRRILYFKIHT